MKPAQFAKIYNHLLDQAIGNTEHKMRGLSHISNVGPVEAILYLPLYSTGKKAHVMSPRILRLKAKAREGGCDLDFFTQSSLDELEALCTHQMFGDFFSNLYDIRRRATKIREIGVDVVIKILQPSAKFPSADEFAGKLKFLKKFRGVADIAAMHILMDIGWPVVKPDRHIQRILSRLGGWGGIFPNDNGGKTLRPRDWYKFEVQWNQTVENIKKSEVMTQANVEGAPRLNQLNSRQIDICLMWFSQAKMRNDNSLDDPICTANPRCDVCNVRPICEHGRGRIEP